MQAAETVLWVAVTTTTDDLSNTTIDEAAPVPLTALVAARSTAEGSNPRAPGVITGKTLYLLDAVQEPSPDDWFTVRGDRYDVEGEAHRWGDMGIEVAVTRTAPVAEGP